MKIAELLEFAKGGQGNSDEDRPHKDGFQIVQELGYKWQEKPDYFSALRDRGATVLSDSDIDRIAQAFKENGLELPEINADDAFIASGASDGPNSGMFKNVKRDAPQTFIITYPSGNSYLVDRTGASTYLRMWIAIER